MGPQRVVIVGTAGSGKSTLAAQVAKRLDVPYVELDSLFWGAGWQPVLEDEFRRRVDEATRADAWVIAGNYSKVMSMTFSRADTVVWLDIPLWLCLWRIFKRTWMRWYRKENLWGTGNYESLSRQFLDRDSLFLWVLRTHQPRRERLMRAFAQPEYRHLRIIQLVYPWQPRQWLDVLARGE